MSNHTPYPYETNPITLGDFEAWRSDGVVEVDLDDPRLARVVRLRLLTDAGFPFWDLSYCYGELKDGSPCRVHLPQWQFSKRRLKADIVEMCRKAGVYAKGLGMLDDSVISKLW